MRTCFIFCLLAIALSVTDAQFVQQGSKLVGTGAVGSAEQGVSVSLSSDGNTAIVGGFRDSVAAGAAWVFTRNDGVWSQQGSKLVCTGAAGGAQLGTSVSLSSDGKTAIVGGFGDLDYVGAAWVFTRSGGVWSQQGEKLVGADGLGRSFLGKSASLSSDGNTAIVGGNGDNNDAGAAWIFTRSGGVWSQQGGKLVGTGAVGFGIYQGTSVSLSSDGNTAIVGGHGDNGFAGAAWVFTRSGGVWSQQGGKLVGTGAVGSAMQGASVSLSSDGNTAIVGGPGDSSDVGAAWVFTRSGGVWTQQGSKLFGTGAAGDASQGESIALSSDGNTAIVGGRPDNGWTGAVWVFTRSGGMWSQQGSKLVGTGAVGSGYQGASVSISSDGNTAIVGGNGDNSYAGAAWVFVRGSTGVQGMGKEVPEHLALHQNYPNPFNPTTNIQFTIVDPRPSRPMDAPPGTVGRGQLTSVKVYDVLGRDVATLVNEVKEPGTYTVRWDASGVASGVYFCRLRAGDFVQTKRMMVVR